jgi:hypothetical protein
MGAPCEIWFFFFGAPRCYLLYLRCNWVALNLHFFDIYITYKKKNANKVGLVKKTCM